MAFQFIDQEGDPLLAGFVYAWQVYYAGQAELPQTYGSRAEAVAEVYRLLDRAELGQAVCIRRVIDGDRSGT